MEINSNLFWLLIGTFTALCGGTAVRIVAIRNADPELSRKRIGSLKVWWTLAVLMALAAVFQRPGAAALLAVASFLGLREFLDLIGKQRIGKAGVIVAYLSIPLQYLLIAMGLDNEAKFILPVGMLLLLSTVRLMGGETQGFIRTTAGVYWGVMLLVFGLSHAALLFTVATDHMPAVGASGWLLFVVIVTEMDDIAQALVGRAIGRRKITPTISPNKTWEGFLGGVFTSVFLSILLAPWLTSFPSVFTSRGLLLSFGSGLLIVSAAFLGDINMSGIKRDAGVKDGSTLLPGQGGMIDRIDSLTFTAPVFYYFVRLMA